MATKVQTEVNKMKIQKNTDRINELWQDKQEQDTKDEAERQGMKLQEQAIAELVRTTTSKTPEQRLEILRSNSHEEPQFAASAADAADGDISAETALLLGDDDGTADRMSHVERGDTV